MSHPRLSDEQSKPWNDWADAKINDGLNAYTREWHNTIGKNIRKTMNKLVDDVVALRRELAELRSQISLKK